jgi:hypothetical protein
MAMRKKYRLNPHVFHTDKDFAKIGARKMVWPDAVHQICAWHQDRAVGERLSKNKLSTVPYNSADVIKHYGYNFVNTEFQPRTQRPNLKNIGEDTWDDGPDEDESELDVVTSKQAQAPAPTNPNTISIPLSQLQRRLEASQADVADYLSDEEAGDLHGGLQSESESELESGNRVTHQIGRESTGLKIRIPAPGQPRGVEVGMRAGAGARRGVEVSRTADSDEEQEKRKPRRIFCPKDLHEQIKKMMTRHQDAHPLIPGYANPTADGIRWWAVKQMYQFCERHDLPEVWAYMWGCWYRPSRWELWARSAGPTVPRLKTTMICESQYVENLATEVVGKRLTRNFSWRLLKHDHLTHNHNPRLDLLIWIIMTRLVPTFSRKLGYLRRSLVRYREPLSWRKALKSEWKRCAAAQLRRSLFLLTTSTAQTRTAGSVLVRLSRPRAFWFASTSYKPATRSTLASSTSYPHAPARNRSGATDCSCQKRRHLRCQITTPVLQYWTRWTKKRRL